MLNSKCLDQLRKLSLQFKNANGEALVAIENIRVSRMEHLDSAKKQVQLLISKAIQPSSKFEEKLWFRHIAKQQGLEERFEELAKIQIPVFLVRYLTLHT